MSEMSPDETSAQRWKAAMVLPALAMGVACAAALATIELLENGLLDNATEMGEYTMDILAEIMARHPSIGDVRGKGLMIGVEFVQDRQTKVPAEGLRERIVDLAFSTGLILLGCGKSVIRFAPPLSVNRSEVDEAMEIFEQAITLAEKEPEFVHAT